MDTTEGFIENMEDTENIESQNTTQEVAQQHVKSTKLDKAQQKKENG